MAENGSLRQAYKKLTVADLRVLLKSRGREPRGLLKGGLIDLLCAVKDGNVEGDDSDMEEVDEEFVGMDKAAYHSRYLASRCFLSPVWSQ